MRLEPIDLDELTALESDQLERLLVDLDGEYQALYGPDTFAWPRDVRHLYSSTSVQVQEHARVLREHRPERPRYPSKARMHRHHRQLTYRVRQLAPGAMSVVLTPTWTGATINDLHLTFMALVRNADGLPLKLPRGGSQRLAELLQGAFKADWTRCQVWHADTNRLDRWEPTAVALRAVA
ncbi:hypothetical protein [Streptomyces violascens]|uniref:hypothetical protein n=1 Tax=Streptomyces violascens TaxID=67381 RepID=UPI003686694E